MEKCELLKGYKEFGDVMSDFIDRYGDKGYDLGIAYCIEHWILATLFIKADKGGAQYVESKI